MQRTVIRCAGEILFVVEKMQSLVAEERDLRMLREKIVQSGRARLLHTGDDEIDAFDGSRSWREKRTQRHVSVFAFEQIVRELVQAITAPAERLQRLMRSPREALRFAA